MSETDYCCFTPNPLPPGHFKALPDSLGFISMYVLNCPNILATDKYIVSGGSSRALLFFLVPVDSKKVGKFPAREILINSQLISIDYWYIRPTPTHPNHPTRLLFSPRTHEHCPQEIQKYDRKYPRKHLNFEFQAINTTIFHQISLLQAVKSDINIHKG